MRSPLFLPSMSLAVSLAVSLAIPLALLAAAVTAATPARAQEPLLLRIRPHDAPLPEGGGSGHTPSDAEIAAQARAAREAVWQRAERRARIAIASVCTGCLKAEPRPEPPPMAVTTASTPPSTPALTPFASPTPAGPPPMRSADAGLPELRPQTEGDL